MNYIEKKLTPLPHEVRLLPVTEDSYPICSASRLVSPMDLSEYGYVEEEYILSGEADIYSWPKGEERPIVVGKGPYCTRILVRKPADPARFSGFVEMESFNGSFKIDHANAGWGLNHEYILESGDAWVGYTKDGNCVQSLLTINPERYAGLGYPNPKPEAERGKQGWDPFIEYYTQHKVYHPITDDNTYERGLTYEAMFQIAALLKRCAPGDPFHGYNVRKVLGFGINDYNAQIAALHPYMRMAEDKPVMDGYLMYMSGEGGQLNYNEDCFPLDDERCCRTCDVPVIKIQTAGDLGGELPHPLWAALWRCEDGDEPGKQMRWYEIPGLGVHAAFRSDKLFFACDEDYEKLGKMEFKQYPYWNQMSRHIMVGALHNLKAWIDEGILPPKAEKIRIHGAYPSIELDLDEDGNHLGGIRHTYLEVPIARYGEDSSIVMFDKEKRDSLYKDQADYVAKVRASAEKMVRDRWILPVAVEALVEQAESLEWN